MLNWKTNLRPVFFTALLICSFSAFIFGQEDLSEMSLDDLLNMEVTTASKKAEKITDAPGIITTISKEEIQYFGANSIQDILEKTPSVQVVGSSLFPSNVMVMRGDLRTHYDNHMLILINGRPIREGIMGGLNSPVYSGFPVDMIERIEIIRGPGSVLYGSNAFVGVINIITDSKKQSSALKIKGTSGSFGTVNASVTGNWVKEDFSAKVSAKLYNYKGWEFSAMTTRPGSPNLPYNTEYGQKNLGIATDLAYKGLSAFAFYTKNVHDMLGILPYATYAGNNKYDRLFLNLGYTHNLGGLWDATINLTHSGTELTLNDDASVPSDHHTSSDYIGEVTVNGQVAENINLIVGGVVDSRNKNEIATGDVIQPYHQIQLSTYVQTDYRPVDDLKLILGAQLNKPEYSKWDLVPRLGAIYNITNELGIKTLYGEAFRSPWPAEQLLDNPVVVGNPNLGPEKIGTLDIQLFYSSTTAGASITYYNSNYTNSISRQPLPGKPGVVTYVNQGNLHMNGFELEGKASLSSNILVTGSATMQNNLDKNTVPVYVPEFMAKLGVFYSISSDLNAGIFNTYFGKPAENKGAKLNPDAKAVNFLSLNITYKLPVSLPLELGMYVQNLFDTEYNYTEYNRGWVNTLPIGGGRAVYGKVSLSL